MPTGNRYIGLIDKFKTVLPVSDSTHDDGGNKSGRRR